MRLDRWPLATLLLILAVLVVGPAPTLAQSKYKEAPVLAEQVKAGKLPPLDQRLPRRPRRPPRSRPRLPSPLPLPSSPRRRSAAT